MITTKIWVDPLKIGYINVAYCLQTIIIIVNIRFYKNAALIFMFSFWSPCDVSSL